MKKYYEITRGKETFIYFGEKNKDVFKKDTLQVFDNLKDTLIDIVLRYPKHRIVNVITDDGKERIDLKDPSFKYQDIYSRAIMLRTHGTGVTNKTKHKKFRCKAIKKRKEYQHKNDQDFIKKGKTIMYPYQETKTEPIPNFEGKKLTVSEYEKDKSGQKLRHNYGYLGYDDSLVDELNNTNCDSYGELKVYKWLKENKIKFYNQEKGHLGCYSPTSGVRMPYDFEIPSLKLVIEVQGIQHYKVTKIMNNTENKLAKQQARDAYKRTFAEMNGYKEIELSYKEMENDSKWQAKLLPLLTEYKSNQQ